MFTISKKDVIKMLEVELKRLKEILVDVNAERRFGWGFATCPVCAEALRITGTTSMTSKKMCKACVLFGIQARCNEIESMRNDAVFDSDNISDTFNYFKRRFAEFIKEVENQLLQVKSDKLKSYSIIAKI